MKIEAVANYADVVGGIAVIISLIYLSIQIRKNSQANQGIAIQQTFVSTQTVYSWHAEDLGTMSLIVASVGNHDDFMQGISS